MSNTEGKRFVFWFIVVIMVIAIVGFTSEIDKRKNAPARAQAQLESQQRDLQQEKARRKREAYVMSQDYVSSRLKAPSTAKFPYAGDVGIVENPDGTFEIAGYVDSQNSFGAMMRTKYLCKLMPTQGNSWILVSLDFLE